jgi:hypothetical protein
MDGIVRTQSGHHGSPEVSSKSDEKTTKCGAGSVKSLDMV